MGVSSGGHAGCRPVSHCGDRSRGTPQASRNARPRRPNRAAREFSAHRRRDQQSDHGPEDAAGDDPDGGPAARATSTAIGAHDRRDELTSAGDQADASPIMAAGKMTSRPKRAGSGIWAPRTTPARVARFHGMNVKMNAPTSSRARRPDRSAGNG